MTSESAREVRVTLAGELDVAGAPRLEDALLAASAGAELVVVDLRRLEFIDCSGAHALVRADRRISRAGGRMVVVRGGAAIRWFFEATGFDGAFELLDRPPRAVSAADDDGPAKALIEAFERQYPVAAAARAAIQARLLEVTTSERDELRSRVVALEQELLDLVYGSPSRIDGPGLWEPRPS